MPDLSHFLANARKELLDLSARNRLINTRRGASRSSRLEIVDELADQVFQHLVTEGKQMSFLSRDESGASPHIELVDDQYRFQPPDDSDIEDSDTESTGKVHTDTETSADEETTSNGDGVAARHRDNRLQTTLDAENLQRRLLKLEREARTYEQEQGVNVLYLAIGFLVWQEEGTRGAERQAPLLLLPMHLARQSASSRFRLSYTGEDLSTNLSIKERLRGDFRIELPEIPESIEGFVPSEYFAEVEAAIQDRPTWKVLPNDMVLWFFSFSKFLMYRNLTSEAWPEDKPLEENPSLTKLLTQGFATGEALFASNDEPIDNHLRVADTVHVVDADSSQAIVIEEVRRGKNLVVQGPPGTGKSQTIANMIAAAVNEGKRVLFVAEKMAALEVVKRRLGNIGLGDICLELHSNKANRRNVLDELDRTLKLQAPRLPNVEEHCAELEASIARLNGHAQMMNTPISDSGLTPYQLIGELTRLREEGARGRLLTIEGCQEWDRATAREQLRKAGNLAPLAAAVGNPSEHPWRGARLEVVLPTDIDRLQDSLQPIAASLEQLRNNAAQLATALATEPPNDGRTLAALANLARRLAAVPDSQRRLISAPAWQDQRVAIAELVAGGKIYRDRVASLESQLDTLAWDTDVLAARQVFRSYGRSWVRWFIKSYCQSVATLRAIAKETPPKGYDERLALFDSLIAGQKEKAELASDRANSLGSAAFADLWRGVDSDWDTLASLVEAEARCAEAAGNLPLQEIAGQLASAAEVTPLIRQIADSIKPFYARLEKMFETVKLEVTDAFDVPEIYSIPLEELAGRVTQWQARARELPQWVSYRTRSQELAAGGMQQAVEMLDNGTLTASEFAPAVETAYLEELMRGLLRSHPELMSFSGATHERIREEFRQLDRERMQHARAVVAKEHYESIPSGSGEFGEIGIIRREINKKSRHLPIRRLITQAGRAIQQVKPVFMMSPLSVAQYIPPGQVEFDLLLIDEASQVQPVDAFGAVALSDQVVVVGDSKQLPPTDFFSRTSGDEDEIDEDDETITRAGDLESILGMYCAQNVTQRTLRWHYRSRHHSLIAFSNHHFYNNELYVIPSPGEPCPGEGLRFEFVADGSYDRGGSRTNRIEARAVAEAVMHHARTNPTRTLGVGAYSVAQRDAILDELEILRRQDPVTEAFFVPDSSEPFFVKNLENIQGDERDHIFISVGYGKDASGYMSMFFGPLSQDGGERRLNVLISRSRECCTVFSSIRADDIDLARTSMPGAVAFKGYLQYAATGLLDTGLKSGGGDYESEFERQVAKALHQHGHKTHPQVGVAGFRIDLAVVDADQPGRYVLGIECDGATYHGSRSARDRDRIRQAVLEDRGWNIHRIWSADWFNHPEQELRRTLAAIEAAYAKTEVDCPPDEAITETATPAVIAREEGDDVTTENIHSVLYEVADFRVKLKVDIHALPTHELGSVVQQIVAVEGPIHEEEVARRVTQLWGLSRTGGRIASAVSLSINKLVLAQALRNDDGFLLKTDQQEISIRDRSQTDLATLRRPEMLPPVEIRAAIELLVTEYFGINREQTIKETARLLGINTVRAALREIIENEIESMLAAGQLQQRDECLYKVQADAI